MRQWKADSIAAQRRGRLVVQPVQYEQSAAARLHNANDLDATGRRRKRNKGQTP